MDFINAVSEFLADKQFAVPLSTVVLFMILNTLCLLLGHHRLGLLISYCFVMYWGFIVKFDYFVDSLGRTTSGLTIYMLAGMAMFATVIAALFMERK